MLEWPGQRQQREHRGNADRRHRKISSGTGEDDHHRGGDPHPSIPIASVLCRTPSMTTRAITAHTASEYPLARTGPPRSERDAATRKIAVQKIERLLQERDRPDEKRRQKQDDRERGECRQPSVDTSGQSKQQQRSREIEEAVQDAHAVRNRSEQDLQTREQTRRSRSARRCRSPRTHRTCWSGRRAADRARAILATSRRRRLRSARRATCRDAVERSGGRRRR